MNFEGIDNEKLDQKTLRILQEAMTKSWSDLEYHHKDLQDLLHALRAEIYLRRQEYAGVAKELQERGFELQNRDSEEHGLAVEEVRLMHPDLGIVVTADYSVGEMTGVGMVLRLPEDNFAAPEWQDIEVLAACTEKDRVKLADQLLTDTVKAMEVIQDGGE